MPIGRRTLQLIARNMVHFPTMRAIGVIVIKLFRGDQLQGCMHSIFSKCKGSMTKLTTDLHMTTPFVRAGYNYIMTKFYTKTGDDGCTSLLGEGRVAKYELRLEAVGTLDEATAALGLARAFSQATETAPLLVAVQRDLYHIMAETAATPENAERFRAIDEGRVAWLEAQVDAVSALVSLPNEFILPGDSQAGGAMALARTIVRRAERLAAQLIHTKQLENQELLHYLNRLSSLCFALELLENQASGQTTPTTAKT